MASSYETCVKETLVNFASQHHASFGTFAQNQFRRLNSKISMQDLSTYARTFDDSINQSFKDLISKRKAKFMSRIGQDFTVAYGQILSWRHDFAHAGVRNTTVEEALKTHRLARWVLYSFDDAFK
jgi:hypothetical protein